MGYDLYAHVRRFELGDNIDENYQRKRNALALTHFRLRLSNRSITTNVAQLNL